MQPQKLEITQPVHAAALPLCSCERPIPRERAERKGAATTYCERCGLPMPLRWR